MGEVYLKPRSSNILVSSLILGYAVVHKYDTYKCDAFKRLKFMRSIAGTWWGQIRDVCYYYRRDFWDQYWIMRLYVSLE
jgi:hypothetical protein